MLLGTCENIDACLSYKTVRDGVKLRLVGTLLLRGPPTYADDIGRLLPNFLVLPLAKQFDHGKQWLEAVGSDGVDSSFFIDGEVYSNSKEHPFQMLKNNLF